jgi:hypothetical protein
MAGQSAAHAIRDRPVMRIDVRNHVVRDLDANFHGAPERETLDRDASD